VNASAAEVDDDVAAGGAESEPHAARATATVAAPVASATKEGQREKFTLDTLQMRDEPTRTRSSRR
jgi:hypothetical protein